MLLSIKKTINFSQLVFVDGFKRPGILGLLFFAISLEVIVVFLYEFIPRDIGRATGEYVLSIGWFSGFLFLLFHSVNVMAWDEGNRTLHTFLARPISRGNYIVGQFFGLALILLFFNFTLATISYPLLLIIKGSVAEYFFKHLSFVNFSLAWIGIFYSQLILLSIISIFSSLVRGKVPVLLMVLSYHLISNGLPVVRNAFGNSSSISEPIAHKILSFMAYFFPDPNRFDFKAEIINTQAALSYLSFANLSVYSLSYVLLVLTFSVAVFKKRDLQ